MRYEDVKQKEVDIYTHPKMQQTEAIKKLVSVCSEPLRRGFVFGSIGDDKTLTLYFEHNAYVHEFTIGHKQILEKMREVYKSEKLAGVIHFTKVIAKIAPKTKAYKLKRDTSCPYDEKSTGNFTNNCENAKLRSLFEDIRGIIKERQ